MPRLIDPLIAGNLFPPAFQLQIALSRALKVPTRPGGTFQYHAKPFHQNTPTPQSYWRFLKSFKPPLPVGLARTISSSPSALICWVRCSHAQGGGCQFSVHKDSLEPTRAMWTTHRYRRVLLLPCMGIMGSPPFFEDAKGMMGAFGG